MQWADGPSGAVFPGPPLDRAQPALVVAAAGQLLIVINEPAAESWDRELEDLFLRVGHRFSRVEPRRRMRDYVRGLLGPVGRENGWQPAEYAGHATPDGLQHLLAGSHWDADGIRDELQHYVAERLGEDGGVLILDDTGFVKKGTTSAGVQRQYSGFGDKHPAAPEYCRCTPTVCAPFFTSPVSSSTSVPPPPRCSTTMSRTSSRTPS